MQLFRNAVSVAGATVSFCKALIVWPVSACTSSAREMRCGQVFMNNYGAGGGVELPFGGVKRSGHGREKGMEAIHEFTAVKTIVHRHG